MYASKQDQFANPPLADRPCKSPNEEIARSKHGQLASFNASIIHLYRNQRGDLCVIEITKNAMLTGAK